MTTPYRKIFSIIDYIKIFLLNSTPLVDNQYLLSLRILNHFPKITCPLTPPITNEVKLTLFKSFRIFFRPLLGRDCELARAFLVQLRDFRHDGVLVIGVGEKTRDGEQHLRDGVGCGPLVFEDVEADEAVRVDVGVIDLGDEVALRRLKRVVSWESYAQLEHSARVWAVVRPDYAGPPVERVALKQRTS